MFDGVNMAAAVFGEDPCIQAWIERLAIISHSLWKSILSILVDLTMFLKQMFVRAGQKALESLVRFGMNR